MPRLALADSSHVDALMRESHALWGAGLTLRDYRALWEEINRCAWARRYARYFVWLGPGGELLSSAKVYRPRLRLLGREGRCTVIGAVFTPRSRRRQGHASRMVRALVEQADAAGDETALLFSDIGTEFYAGLGFCALPAEEHWGRLPAARAGSSRIELRKARPEDLPAIGEAHQVSSLRRPLALMRDLQHWEFLWVRAAGFFDRLRDHRVHQAWYVACRDGAFVGYLVVVQGHGEWNVREVGAVDGDPRTMASIVQQGARAAYADGLRRFYGWLCREVVERLEGWTIRSRRRQRSVPMLRTTAAGVDLRDIQRAEHLFIPFHDQF